ncbi:MAG: hypothetical protein KQA41_03880 [Candidatus Aenigmarchaeota archaeon]|nr:hypothetical protein [Candidatus Aenigmarchaeota archaeon]
MLATRDVEKNYFIKNGWELRTCRNCGSEFYSKNEIFCNSYECIGGYRFLERPRPRRFFSLEDGCKQIEKYLLTECRRVQARPIVRSDRTLFASAAGQIFDAEIYEGSNEKSDKVFCFQPVIRLQNYGGHQNGGYSSSFVNLGIEIFNPTPHQHVESINLLLNLLSSLGLYVGHLCFKRKTYPVNDWGNIQTSSESLKIYYGGLEIGIINYFYIPDNRSMSDISLGIERLIWAINRTTSYFDAIGPLEYVIFIKDEHLFDAVRTLSLMASAGVVPGPKNHGSKFRMVASTLSDPNTILPLEELVQYYYLQWKFFIEPISNLTTTWYTIKNEISRLKNRNILERLGMNFRDERLNQSIYDLVRQDSSIIEKLRGC